MPFSPGTNGKISLPGSSSLMWLKQCETLVQSLEFRQISEAAALAIAMTRLNSSRAVLRTSVADPLW
jgi:hypothetical protein